MRLEVRNPTVMTLVTMNAILLMAVAYFVVAKVRHSTGADVELPAYQALVRSVMIDPESARFGEAFSSAHNKDIWCGRVNGKNRFGAMTGEKRFVAQLNERKVTFEYDPLKFNEDANAKFAGQWHLYCE